MITFYGYPGQMLNLRFQINDADSIPAVEVATALPVVTKRMTLWIQTVISLQGCWFVYVLQAIDKEAPTGAPHWRYRGNNQLGGNAGQNG